MWTVENSVEDIEVKNVGFTYTQNQIKKLDFRLSIFHNDKAIKTGT